MARRCETPMPRDGSLPLPYRGGTFLYCPWWESERPGSVTSCLSRLRTPRAYRRHYRRWHLPQAVQGTPESMGLVGGPGLAGWEDEVDRFVTQGVITGRMYPTLEEHKKAALLREVSEGVKKRLGGLCAVAYWSTWM